ncbi:hypothetical protein Zmor_014471 [Zophobas morio]|uniref:Uncharacterized protein n=1 Tax=Zophobas morio TaxID=2755281 RepID=A0AA38IEN3_9CUCU|nr:hypothetical protein Zmor_014471 [Zophobas morio]
MSTLWCRYSMLRATVSITENIDISKYSKLIAFIKRQTSGYKSKKSRTFEKEDFYKFLSEAPIEMYLCMKVVLIIGVAGGCKIDELHKIRIDGIEEKESVLIISLPDTKTNKKRKFTIINEACQASPGVLNYFFFFRWIEFVFIHLCHK